MWPTADNCLLNPNIYTSEFSRADYICCLQKGNHQNRLFAILDNLKYLTSTSVHDKL